MSLVKWDAWRDMEDVFDRYFRRSGLPATGSQESITGSDWAPRVDIAETDAAFEIKAEIPDVKKEDVHVSVDNGVLTLRGERKQEKEEKDKKFHRVERFYGSFSRSFTLPENVDADAIKASFKDGVLKVDLPKTRESKPAAISVRID